MRSKLPNVGTTIFAVMSAMANKFGAINLAQGFPNFNPNPKLLDLVRKYVDGPFHQYAPLAGVPELLNSLSIKIEQCYQTKVDPTQEITVTAGATQAIFTAIGALVHPGDEVIVFDPTYDCYVPAIELFGGIPVAINLNAPNFQIDWDEVRNRITPRTRVIMINTPHNPCGTVFSEQDIDALRGIVNDHPISIISDEVYEHIIFDGHMHRSMLKYPELYERSLITFSFGKTLHATGWKLGYCVGAKHLMKEFNKVHQFNVFCVNRPLQHAISEYILEPSTYESLSEFYQEKRDKFKLSMARSNFELLTTSGSYFILADYSRISDLDDMKFAEEMTKEHGVASIPLSPFYIHPPENQRVVRFCFAKTDDVMTAAAEKLNQITTI